jgi:hypothetical protein
MKLIKNHALTVCIAAAMCLVLGLLLVALLPVLQVNSPKNFNVSFKASFNESATETADKITGAIYTATPFLPQPSLQQAPLTLVYYAPKKMDKESVTLPPVVLKPLTNHPHSQALAKIAIVIDDMGVNVQGSANMLTLPKPLTLAFLPYGRGTKSQAAQGLANGHQLIVHIPMEPEALAQNNPGPNALLVGNSKAKNLKRVAANLAGFDGYVGVNNHMGSRFTANAKAMQPVLAELKKRGLFFLDSRTIGNSVGGSLAQQMGLPFAVRDVFLDNIDNKQAVMAQLKQLEAIAQKRGFAVAIGHPHRSTYEALKAWLPTLPAKNIKLVKLSALVTAP